MGADQVMKIEREKYFELESCDFDFEATIFVNILSFEIRVKRGEAKSADLVFWGRGCLEGQ